MLTDDKNDVYNFKVVNGEQCDMVVSNVSIRLRFRQVWGIAQVSKSSGNAIIDGVHDGKVRQTVQASVAINLPSCHVLLCDKRLGAFSIALYTATNHGDLFIDVCIRAIVNSSLKMHLLEITVQDSQTRLLYINAVDEVLTAVCGEFWKKSFFL